MPSVTPEAFDLLRYVARLLAGRLTVVDSTNVHARARQRNLEFAATCGVPAVALVVRRPSRAVTGEQRAGTGVLDEGVIRQHRTELDEDLPLLDSEGFDLIHVLDYATLESAEIQREVEG